MKKNINVLVTAVGAPGAPDIIFLLKEDSRIRVIGLDINENAVGRYLVDDFNLNLPGSHDMFSENLLNIAIKKKVDVIFPLSTDELVAISKNINLFSEKGIRVCISDYKTISISNDKLKVYDFFKKEAFIPKYQVPRSFNDIERKLNKMGFPEVDICVKPFVSHGSRGTRIITDNINQYGYSIQKRPFNIFIGYNEFINSLNKKLPPIYFSEYLPGEEWGVDIFVDPNNHTNKIIGTRSNGDVQSSSVMHGELIKNEKLIDIAQKIIKKLKFCYIINLDIKYSNNGTPKLIEINPRVPAAINLISNAGNNFPLLSVKRALGEKVDFKEIQYGKQALFLKKSIVI